MEFNPHMTHPSFPQLDPIGEPVYFLCEHMDRYRDVLDGVIPPDANAVFERFRDARDSWSTQPFLQLLARGLDVHLTAKLVPGAINIAPYDQLRISARTYNSFVVCCRHDRGIPRIADAVIVQNEDNVYGANDYYLPHWPQPGLIGRPRDRGVTIKNLAYKGRKLNLAPAFRSPEFIATLQNLGVTLAYSPDDEAARVRDCVDYQEVDVVLAVRDCTEYNLSIKPPSKLFNAWLAGCPAILGPESAYRQLRRTELDYFEVRTPEEVVRCIERLKREPGLYEAMVANGLERGREYTSDRTAERWRDLLAGPIMRDFKLWKASGVGASTLRRLSYPLHAAQHRMERRSFLHQIDHGPRPLRPTEAQKQ